MTIPFLSSFYHSLKTFHCKNKVCNKIYEFLRYDLWRFISNVYLFRKELYQFYDFDSIYSLNLFKRALELNKKNIVNGYESEKYKNIKIDKISRAIEILNHIKYSEYIELAENQLFITLSDMEPLDDIQSSKTIKFALTQNDHDIFNLADKLEEDEWCELWMIIKGTKLKDGTDLRGWWN